MTFSPKKKTSKSRSKTRTSARIKRTAKKLEDKTMLNKEGNGLAHFVNENGEYNGRQVIVKKEKSKGVTRI